VPLASSCRGHSSCVERLRNLPEGTRAGLLGLTDNGEHVGSVPVRFRPHGLHGAPAGHIELRVAKRHSASLSGGERLTGAGGYESAFFLGKRGKQVQDKRVNVRPSSATRKGTLWAMSPPR
jgi:hypothetical protein